MLDYEYLKNHFRLIAADLIWQKKLDVDLQAIQQIEIDGKLKRLDDNGNATDADTKQFMFVSIILEKMGQH